MTKLRKSSKKVPAPTLKVEDLKPESDPKGGVGTKFTNVVLKRG